MRTISAAAIAGAMAGATKHHLIWIEAINRDTGAVEGLGLWTGLLTQTIMVEGVARTFAPMGDQVGIPSITSAEGLNIQSHTFDVSKVTDQFRLAVEVYDARRAQFSLYVGEFDAATDVAFADPTVELQGIIKDITIDDGASGMAAIIVHDISYFLTQTLAVKKSDAAQRRRLLPDGSEDRFRRHADNSGLAGDWWGQLPPSSGV